MNIAASGAVHDNPNPTTASHSFCILDLASSCRDAAHAGTILHARVAKTLPVTNAGQKHVHVMYTTASTKHHSAKLRTKYTGDALLTVYIRRRR